MNSLCLIATRGATIVLGAVFLGACQTQAPTPAVVAKPAPIVRQPIAQLLADATRENAELQKIHDTNRAAGNALGDLNGKLQSRGYFRRIPTNSAIDSLESSLRAVAAQKILTVVKFSAAEVPDSVVAQKNVLKPGQRWVPTIAQYRGIVTLRVELGGPIKDIKAFVDLLPLYAERLIVLQKAEKTPNGAILSGEAYYEREMQPPDVDIRWPTLEERLKAGGWQPNDPKLASDPDYAALVKQVDMGRTRMPETRHTLKISADFPRWLLRQKFFDERGKAELAVNGEQLLSGM